jgi:hypothetical protein
MPGGGGARWERCDEALDAVGFFHARVGESVW